MLTSDVKELLKDRVMQAGSLSLAAQNLGISKQFLSAVLGGQRNVSRKILDVLRLRRVVLYEPRAARKAAR
jgi:hypothetical protein